MQAESNGDTEVSAVSWIVKEKKRMKQVEPLRFSEAKYIKNAVFVVKQTFKNYKWKILKYFQ